MNREDTLRQRLQAAFSPPRLEIVDDSQRHAGHAGARGGGGHFRVLIVSAAFAGQSPLARHRAVYAALDGLLQSEIHALAIDARVPGEP